MCYEFASVVEKINESASYDDNRVDNLQYDEKSVIFLDIRSENIDSSTQNVELWKHCQYSGENRATHCTYGYCFIRCIFAFFRTFSKYCVFTGSTDLLNLISLNRRNIHFLFSLLRGQCRIYGSTVVPSNPSINKNSRYIIKNTELLHIK
jgi:hypothetical protein